MRYKKTEKLLAFYQKAEKNKALLSIFTAPNILFGAAKTFSGAMEASVMFFG